MSKKGRFVWFDLMTSDPEAAAAFYKEVLGLTTEAWQGGEEYLMFKAGEQNIGGVMELPAEASSAGAPSHWLGYIACEDVDATIAAVERSGGAVLKSATEIPDGGKFAILADPAGAAFAVYASAKPDERDISGSTPGQVSWLELGSSDHAKALSFYIDNFGWQRTNSMDMGEGNMYDMFGTTEESMGGSLTKPAEQGPSSWLFYFRVSDVAQAIDKAQAGGGTLLNGPMDVPGGEVVAQLLDPQGAVFAVVGAGPA